MKNFSSLFLAKLFILATILGISNQSFAGEALDNIRKTNKIILCAGPYA